MSTTKPVQMRFSESTVNRVNQLSEYTKETNRTQIVAQAIALYYEVIRAQKENEGVPYIEYPDGVREKLVLVGSN